MGKGGGSAPAQPTTQTVQQSNIPEYARPYFEDIMTRGQAASQVQYQPYTGERVAPFSPMQQQAFQGIQGLGPSPLIGAGAGLTGLAAQQASQAGQYQPMAPQQTYQGPQFQQAGISYLATQAPELQQFQMGPVERVQAAQAGSPLAVQGPQLQQFGMGPAERVRTGSFAQPGMAEAYMSPYMQNVVEMQQRDAQRQADIARTQRGAQAVGAGAFGGSRQAIMEAEAARNLALQKGDIQAAGLQSAFQQAQQAYQTDAARRLQAQMANQQAGLTVGGQNLAAALGVQQLGAQTGLQAQLANQQAMQQTALANQQAAQQAALANQQAGLTMGQQNLAAALGVQQLGAQTGLQSQQLNQAAQLQAQQQALGQSQAQNLFNQQNAQLAAQYGLAGLQAAEQSRQFGAGLGMQGAGMLGQLGGQFGQLGQQAFGQQAAALQAQQQAGAIQQAQGQQQRDLAYEEFMRQQLYPQSQLQFLSSLLRGSVVAPQQTMYSYQQQPSMVSQLGGLGLGALGLSKAFGAKDGGEVPGYADGGEVERFAEGGLASNVAKLTKFLMASQNPEQDVKRMGGTPIEKYLAMQKVQQLRSAMQNQQALDRGVPQGTVMDEAGLANMDAGVMEDVYAGGGIVAFQEGGMPWDYARSAQDDDQGYSALTPWSTIERGVRRGDPRAIAYAEERLRKGPGLFGIAPPASLTEFMAGRQAGLPAALPQQAAPATPDAVAAQNQRELNRLPPPAPRVQPRLEAPPARAAATAAPAVKPEESDVLRGLRDELKGLESPEDAEEAARKRMRAALPDDLKERLEGFKAQAEQAKKDRDQDRWLAVAMGGFAAAAGSSPYALKNFGEGLGLTSKELMNVNKDFRKAEQERRKLETEEKRLARAESMGIEKEAQAARERAIARRDAYNKALLTGELKLKEIAEKRFETETRERVGMAQVAATKEGNAAYREAALRSRDIQAFNTAVQKEKDTLLKANPTGGFTDPGFEAKMEQQAMRNVIARNPQFAELAGVSMGAVTTPQSPLGADWGKATVVGGK